MKVHIERNTLLKALSHAQSVVEKRTTVPILSHVLLEAAEGTLKLTATDLELAIIETIEADVEQAGSTTVVAHTLYDIVRKLQDGSQVSLIFEENESQVKFLSGSSQFSLAYLKSTDFPPVQALNLPYHFSLPVKDFSRLLEKAKFAMSSEETRYYLNGIYLHLNENNELRAVATDGHRLACISLPSSKKIDPFPGIILSRKTIHEILKISTGQNGDIEIHLSETQISFIFEKIFLTSRLIDGTFPDYEKAIPKTNDKFLHLKMDVLSQAVDRVSTIASERNRGIKIKLEKDKLTLSTVNSELGSAIEELEIDYQCEPVEIGFNARYLLDIAQQLSNTNVEFSLADVNTAVIIQDVTEKQSKYVLMPLKI